MKGLRRAANALEKTMSVVFTLCGGLAVLFVLVITVFLVLKGFPPILKIGAKEFFLGKSWVPTAENPSYGILSFILTSVYGCVGAIIISVPIGILCAVFIAKLAPKPLAKALLAAAELLSGIPSVVYGLLGMFILVPFVRDVFDLADGANLFSALLVLSAMLLPSVILVSTTALLAVPREYEEASAALGATKIETVFRVVLPAAKSGVLTAVVLGAGRSIGEAMAVMMVSGNVANMPRLFKSVRFLTTAIAGEMSYASGLQREALFSVALVLFGFIMLLNLALNLIVKKSGRKER